MNDSQAVAVVPTRGRFYGVSNIVRFNWPFYVATMGVGAVVIGFLLSARLPFWILWVGWSGIGLAFFWLLVSLLVSFYVYDVSPLYRWDWLRPLFPEAPQSWANIHSGLDESSLQLQALFPAAKSYVLDIYDPQEMTEASIKRARAAIASPVQAIVAECAALPLADHSMDAIFLLFAAHEIREPSARLGFFRELKRATAPGGRVIVVEHLRDAANFMAFGPGFWHFMPRNEWLRLSDQSGFVVAEKFRITPFVMVLVLENSSDGDSC